MISTKQSRLKLPCTLLGFFALLVLGACGTNTSNTSEPDVPEPNPPAEVKEAETVASGLNGPMGLLIDPEDNLWVADSGVGGDEVLEEIINFDGEVGRAQFGNTARVVQVAPNGTQNEVAKLPSITVGGLAIGAAHLALLDNTLFVTSGIWTTPGTSPKPKMATVSRVAEGETVQVADLWAFENENDPDGSVTESNPHGLAAYEGDLLVTDAGANTLLRVDPGTGEVSVVAVFEGVPGSVPNESRGGALLNDPVPTGVTVDGTGTIYVSFLPGLPPLPGSAKVVQVTPEGEVSDYATGLDLLTDLQAAPDGNLYAVQMAEFGEQGPVPDTGRVFRIVDGEATEVLSGLPFPTAIAFNDEGDAFVTHNGIGAPGSGEVVRYSGLAVEQTYNNPYSIFESSLIR